MSLVHVQVTLVITLVSWLNALVWAHQSSLSRGPLPTWYACRSLPSAALKDDSSCIPAVVPGTALLTLLENGTFSSLGVPNASVIYQDDLLSRLPDISGKGVGPEYYTFWYVVKLTMPQVPPESTVWLTLRGLNYRATVLWNRQLLSPVQTHPEQRLTAQPNGELVGMFRRWTFVLPSSSSTPNSTPYTGELAIRVQPPDFPGVPNVGQGGNHDIAKNAAEMQFSAGWDWIQATPDRNTGIWDQVLVQVQPGSARLAHLHLDTTAVACMAMPVLADCRELKRTSAHVRLNVSILTALDLPLNGSVTFTVTDSVNGNGSVVYESASLPFVLPKGGTPITVSTAAVVDDVELWWPHTHGTPYLYTLTASLRTNTSSESVEGEHEPVLHNISVNVGLRIVDAYIDSSTEGQAFAVNGVRVFLEGGNWITTDQLLRYASDEARYDAEVRMHQRMGLNLIRVWGGGITERPEFYSACDRFGVMVMQEFWMTGDNNGRWAGNYTWPLDHEVYMDNAFDSILMLRPHASLLFWCGGNELYPAGKSPPSDILSFLQSTLATLDPTRFFIPSSMSNYTHFNTSFALAPKDGPYGILDVRDFARRNPGMKYPDAHSPVSFQPELGSVSTPVYSSLTRFLSKEVLDDFPVQYAGFDMTDRAERTRAHDLDAASTHMATSTLTPTPAPTPIPVNPVWAYHNYIPFTDANGTDHIYAYGAVHNSSEYAFRAQLVQYAQFRALFESFQQYMWRYYSAIIFWKSQSPWPVLRGSFYDYWLAMTGGAWGVRDATKSLKLQLRLEDLTLCVVNKSPFPSPPAVTVRVDAYTWTGQLATTSYEHTLTTAVASNSVVWLPEKMPWPPISPSDSLKGTPVYFFRFLLIDEDDNELVAPSWYWLSNPALGPQDYSVLGLWRDSQQVHLNVSVAASFKKLIRTRPAESKTDSRHASAFWLAWSSPSYYGAGQSQGYVVLAAHLHVDLFNPFANILAFAVRSVPLLDMTSKNNRSCYCTSQEGDVRADGQPVPILPATRSDDYMTLLPFGNASVSIEVELSCSCGPTVASLDAVVAEISPSIAVLVEGWNVHPTVYPLSRHTISLPS